MQFVTTGGKLAGSYSYDGGYLHRCSLGGDGYAALLLGRYKSGSQGRLVTVDSQGRELDEACAAGEAALATAEQIADSLRSAEEWGDWDIVGGGLISGMAKHRHLDEAQASVERLQSQMRRFKTELADVTINADIQVSIDGFLRVADYFFDGIFADWAVLDQIRQSQQQVQLIRNQIEIVLNHLYTLINQTDAELSRISREIEQLVAGISM